MFNDILKEYLAEKTGIKLLAIGKIHEFREGCACPMGALSTEMLRNLELNDKEVVIVDKTKIAGIIPANNDVFKACLAGEERDLQLAEIEKFVC